MSNDIIGIAIALIILAGAIPYVAHHRHPNQRPLAAYLIFFTVFIVSAAILFSLLGWFVTWLELGNALTRPVPALMFIILIFLPSVLFATWLAQKPPWQRGPPN